MSLTLKYKILLFLFFITMITSLWPNNIYLLFLFSVASWILLPYNKWWDGISISLFFFSFFYCLVHFINKGTGSGFIFLSTLTAPVSFYRFGRWIMTWLVDDRKRSFFLFYFALSYFFPVFLLTLQDIFLVGLVNDTRIMLSDIGKEDTTLAATLYGLMASVGVGFISILFTSSLKKIEKLLFSIITIISMLTVVHLVNRTGIVLFIACLIFSVFYSTRLRPIKMLAIFLFLLFVVFIVFQFGIISQDILDAYLQREDSTTANAAEFGGRSDLWNIAFMNVFISPFGWVRERYAHNLWLDLAAIGGWFALFPFLAASFAVIKNFFKVLIMEESSFRILLLSMFLSMFLNSMVEPVIEGSLLFFVLFMMIWGMLKSVSREDVVIYQN